MMRDDRYQGTSLSRQVRKLCRMSEREADRAQPERMREQAVVALVSDANRQISTEFLHRLQERNEVPRLFDANELSAVARSSIEVDIARAILNDGRVDAIQAIGDALCYRITAYQREQKCQLIADRHPEAIRAPKSVQKACAEALLVASVLIFDGSPPPKVSKRPALTENLLSQQLSGVAP